MTSLKTENDSGHIIKTGQSLIEKKQGLLMIYVNKQYDACLLKMPASTIIRFGLSVYP
jgi:hypothetical protein